MTYRIIYLFLVLLMVSSAESEEPLSLHLTGVPKVDLFSPNWLSSNNFSQTIMMQELLESSLPQEKSPWIASLLSLAVPGAGEVYAESYLKGALFFAVEAASWLVVYNFDKKGDQQTEFFQNYANTHWSAVRYVNWTMNNLSVLNPDLNAGDYDPLRGNPAADCEPPFSCVNWEELNRLERDVASGRTNGYTHVLPYYAEQQYFELIGKYDQFSRGWDDADLNDNNIPIRSNSQMYYAYARMRAKANDYYDVAGAFVSVVVVNHILSALDAYWSTARYNNALRAEVKMKMLPSPIGTIRVTEAKVIFYF